MVFVTAACQGAWSPAPRRATSAGARARADIRAAIPAIEAFRADNGTYARLTVSVLRVTYDSAVPDVRIVVKGSDSYCVESTVEDVTYSKARPDAVIRPGPCLDPPGAMQRGPTAAVDQLRRVAVVMEARLYRTGSFQGTDERWLRSMIPGLRPLTVVSMTPQSYCIEMTGQGHTYVIRGPTGDVSVGRC